MFGELAIAYLFSGGAGAAACVALAVLGLGVPRNVREAFLGACLDDGKTMVYRRFFSIGHAAALLALALGAFCLLLDAGRPDRVLLLFSNPTPTFMSVGAYALAILLIVSVLSFLVWLGALRVSQQVFFAFSVLSLACGIVVVGYTALLLGTMESVPLWSNGWVLALFLLSSASCGLALVMGSVQLSGAARAFGSVLKRLALADALLIVIELGVVAAFLLDIVGQLSQFADSVAAFNLLAEGGTSSLRGALGASGAIDVVGLAGLSSVVSLTYGSNAWLFWGGFSLVGLVVPLSIELAMLIAERRANAATAAFSRSMAIFVASFCVLAGGLLLRWCIVSAGVQPAMFFGA